MINVPGYRIIEKLKAYSISDDKVVGIKKMNKETKRPNDHAEIIHDFHVTIELQGAYVLQPKS